MKISPTAQPLNIVALPSHAECLKLMAAHTMLPNIREHSFRVMQVADLLGRSLAAAGFTLHLELISTGALLHDIAKTACLGTTNNHAHLGAEILVELGYPELAQVVREHVRLEDAVNDPRPLRESEVVNYADKRVLHTRVVSLAERFADLIVRYGRTTEARSRIAAMEIKTLALEEKLFKPLRLNPADLLQANGDDEFKVQGSRFKVK